MGEALRFLVVGGVTTLLTYAVYLAMLPHMAPLWAYAVALVAGTVFQTATALPFAFKARVTPGRAWRFVVLYLAYAAASATVLEIVIHLGVPPVLAPLCVLLVVTPAQFLLARRLARNPGTS